MVERFVRPRLGFYWYLFEPLAIFILAFFLAWAIFDPPEMLSGLRAFEWGDGLVTILATFIGAMAAFFLESWRDRKSQSNKDLASGRLIFFKLSRMVNRLANIKRGYVDPYRDNPARCLGIPALLAIDASEPILDMDSLHFMFVKHANLLGEMAIAKDQFQSVIELINERSRFMREEIQPRLKAAEVPQEFNMQVGRLSQILGSGNLQEAINLTDQLVESLDRIEQQVIDVTNRFGAALTQYFPSVRLGISLVDAAENARHTDSGAAARTKEELKGTEGRTKGDGGN